MTFPAACDGRRDAQDLRRCQALFKCPFRWLALAAPCGGAQVVRAGGIGEYLSQAAAAIFTPSKGENEPPSWGTSGFGGGANPSFPRSSQQNN